MLSDNLRDFWAHQFFGRQFFAFEYGSDFCAAECNVFFFAVWASFFMGNSSASSAMKEGFEKQWAYAQVWESFKDFLGCVWLVVVAYAGVVSANDEMGASEVFRNNGIQKGVSGPCHSQRG